MAAGAMTIQAAPPAVVASAYPGRVLVVCAPGYPGDTQQAQPTMDAFASAVTEAAGWPAGSLGAAYYETEAGGIDRLGGSDAALTLVPYPFFEQHGAELALKPQLMVADAAGSTEVWSLAAKRGRVTSAASLGGWDLTGTAGYAPDFVKGSALGDWGILPASVRITFSPGVLLSLRRASQGENVAVLLDGPQTASLRSLPFASQIEVVTRSKALPKSLLCTVGDRISSSDLKAATRALLHLHEKPSGQEVLTSMRMTRFEPVKTKLMPLGKP